jgi:hypothetical protein
MGIVISSLDASGGGRGRDMAAGSEFIDWRV